MVVAGSTQGSLLVEHRDSGLHSFVPVLRDRGESCRHCPVIARPVRVTWRREFGLEKVTIIDVARVAGVSAQTVSRVINNRPGMNEATRLRVQAVIDKLGYEPNVVARGLVTNRTMTLGLIVPDVANAFFAEIVQGAEEVAWNQGYSILLCDTKEDLDREAAALRSLRERRVDGVIICSARLPDERLWPMLEQHRAAVVINRRAPEGVASSVRIDYATGTQRAVEHLLRSGRRKLAFLTGVTHAYGGQERLKGLEAALREAAIVFPADQYVACQPTIEGGYDAAQTVLRQHLDVDGLVCYNDLVAVGALQACAERGLSVPDDVAVVGCDDIPLAALVTPSLTTFGLSKHALGERSAEFLLARIKGDGAEHEDLVLEPTLVVRSSAP